MSIFYRNCLVAWAIFMLPIEAYAVTVSHSANLVSGQLVNEASTLSPGDEIQYIYNVLEAFSISSIALSATSTFAGEDIAHVRFGYTSPGTTVYTTITEVGSSSFGGGFLPGLTVAAGDVFSAFFSDGITRPITVGLSFNTKAITAVPLPAARASSADRFWLSAA